MRTLTVNIDMGRKCDRCGKPGATDAGVCLKCASKLITGGIMAKDAIDLTLIGGKLEHLDGLCRAKRAAATDFNGPTSMKPAKSSGRRRALRLPCSPSS